MTLYDQPVSDQPARPVRLLLRAGAVDARPHDAAGRAALRPRVELLPRADGRAGALLPAGGALSAHRRASRAITTSLRAPASRSMCSAPARRPSRSNVGPVPRGRAERRALHRRSTRPAACRRRRRGRGPMRTSNFVADCDLLNGAHRILRATGGESAARTPTPTSGRRSSTRRWIPTLLSGWGVRSGDWQVGASVQQEVLPRVAVEVGYQRRWLVNFIVTDNLNRAPPRTTRRSASTSRSIRGCRTAAAACSTGCTT